MLRAILRQGGIGFASAAGCVAFGAPLLLTHSGFAQSTPPKPSTPPKTAVPALYPTRAEAEQAAKSQFHCTGAHQMGAQWMPCALHPSAPRDPLR